RPAGHVVDQLPETGAHGHLVDAGAPHGPGDLVELRALAVLRAHRGEPGRAPGDDVHGAGQALDVVDRRRLPVEASGRRERRLESRVRAQALQGVHQRGLLAADVGAGAAVHGDVEGVAGAEDVPAQEARLARLPHRLPQTLVAEVVL